MIEKPKPVLYSANCRKMRYSCKTPSSGLQEAWFWPKMVSEAISYPNKVVKTDL